MNTTAELARMAGITKRMVQLWAERNIIKSRRRRRFGQRFFDDDQVFKTFIVRELRRRGITLRKIGRLKILPVRADYLLMFRNRVEWAGRESLIKHIKRLHSPVLLVSIQDLQVEFCTAMERRAGGYYTASLPDHRVIAAS